MSGHEEYIRWFSEISNDDVSIAGGKGASLGEMYNSGFPVPPGFVITAQAYDYFITSTGIKEKIKAIIDSVETEDTEQLAKKSKEIRALIESQQFPDDLKSEIIEAYHILGSEKIDSRGISDDALNILKNSQEPVFVAIRSSATTEDLGSASFAGQQESFLNVKGDVRLIDNVKKCFSSLYTARAIYYRKKQGFGAVDALLAAVVMKMIDSEKSGVMFSKSPVGDSNMIAVEAVYGLGEGIVSGQINPDHYDVSRDLQIKNIKLGDKKIAIVRTGSGQNGIAKLTQERSKSQVMTNGQIIEAANYALRLEEHYGKPQDIEFAIEANKFYVVQSRPVTTLQKEVKKTGNISGKIILGGQGSSPGVGIGNVKIIKTMADLPKIRKGDVLVTEMTNPDMVVAMEKSVAIVTDEGGMTSHAAIVSREMGIPCVVGTGNATKILKEGMKITVDGASGKVYDGEVGESKQVEIKKVVVTNSIKIKVIVDLPESAERAALTGIDAVGLTRVEGIIAEGEKHPVQYEKEKDFAGYTEILRKGLDQIAKHFETHWIRTSDIRSDEYSNLKGAPDKEINPMLGLHGIRFSLKHQGLFEAELNAIKKVAEKYPGKKFGVMIPQVCLTDEVVKSREFFEKYKTPNMEFGVMIETPAAVQVIDSICKAGIDFISFGTNDLTQFTLAVDRGEEDVQFLYNELNPAIFSQIKRVIRICKENKVYTSICGQAASKKEMAEFLFNQGIDSLSVNADAAYEISSLIKDLEEKKEKENEERKKIQEQKKEERKQKQDEIKKARERSQEEERKKKEKYMHDKKNFPIYREPKRVIEDEPTEDMEIESNDSLLNKEHIKIAAEIEGNELEMAEEENTNENDSSLDIEKIEAESIDDLHESEELSGEADLEPAPRPGNDLKSEEGIETEKSKNHFNLFDDIWG